MVGLAIERVTRRGLRHSGLLLYAIVAGAAGGWLAEWPAALLEMRLTGAGYTGTQPHWDAQWATFSATVHGSPFGAFFGALGYVLVLRTTSARRIVASTPLLWAATLLGALLGSPAGALRLLLAPTAFFLACGFVAKRDAAGQPM